MKWKYFTSIHLGDIVLLVQFKKQKSLYVNVSIPEGGECECARLVARHFSALARGSGDT